MQEGIKVASHISDKGIVSRVYKRLLQLNNKKTNDLILKREKKYFNIDKPMRQKIHMKRHDTIILSLGVCVSHSAVSKPL